MNNYREFRIGITVFGALTALVILTIVFGKAPSINFGSDNIIKVRFQRAPGIARKSPVFKNGVRIGDVSAIRLVDGDRVVEVSLRIPSNRQIYTDEICQIHQTMIMGDASLEFVRNPQFEGEPALINPNETLLGSEATDIMNTVVNLEGDLRTAIKNVADAAGKFNAVSAQVGDFVEKANIVVGTESELKARSEKFDALLANAEKTITSFRQMSDGMNKFVTNPAVQEGIKHAAANLPEIVDKSKTLISETNRFIKDAKVLLERGGKSFEKVEAGIDKASAALESIKNLTDRIEGDVPETIAALKKSSLKLESFFDEITLLVHTVNNSDGSIMKLFKEPEFYNKLISTLDNADVLLQTELKPIASNVRVLTDKAARDPAIFIRNLLKRQPRTKNLPYWSDGLGSDGMCFGKTRQFVSGQCIECLEQYEDNDGTIVPMAEDHSDDDTGEIIYVDPRYPIQQTGWTQKKQTVPTDNEPESRLVFAKP